MLGKGTRCRLVAFASHSGILLRLLRAAAFQHLLALWRLCVQCLPADVSSGFHAPLRKASWLALWWFLCVGEVGLCGSCRGSPLVMSLTRRRTDRLVVRWRGLSAGRAFAVCEPWRLFIVILCVVRLPVR